MGKNIHASVGIIDSQSVKTVLKGDTNASTVVKRKVRNEFSAAFGLECQDKKQYLVIAHTEHKIWQQLLHTMATQ